MISIFDQIFRRSRGIISDTHPFVDETVSAAVRYYATSWVRVATVLGSVRYDAPIDPERLYEIDPEKVKKTVSWTRISADRKADEHPLFRRPKYRLAGRVFDGDWDMTTQQFSDSTIYQSFVAHFQEGVPWEETDFYNETLAAIEAGGTPWDCQSRSDLDRRCVRLDRIYEQIEQQGYKTQNELHDLGDPTTSPYRIYRVIWSEIAVNIGRDGEFIFQDGRNRLAMARVLGLERVPVVILVRHSHWQQKRNRIARGELERSALPERLQNHPDLIELF